MVLWMYEQARQIALEVSVVFSHWNESPHKVYFVGCIVLMNGSLKLIKYFIMKTKPIVFINVRGIRHEASRSFVAGCLVVCRQDGFMVKRIVYEKLDFDADKAYKCVKLWARAYGDSKAVCVFNYTKD